MKLKILKTDIEDTLKFMRRCGYGYLRSRSGGKDSFVKRLRGELYPRFHLYIEDDGDNWSFNLHLDQKAPVYRGVTAHSGDYDGVVIEREMERIKIAFESL